MEGTREDRRFLTATPVLSAGNGAAEAAPFKSGIDGYLRYLPGRELW
jgi:hypothetical protein